MESSQHRAGQPESAGLLLLKTSAPLRGDSQAEKSSWNQGWRRAWVGVSGVPAGQADISSFRNCSYFCRSDCHMTSLSVWELFQRQHQGSEKFWGHHQSIILTNPNKQNLGSAPKSKLWILIKYPMQKQASFYLYHWRRRVKSLWSLNLHFAGGRWALNNVWIANTSSHGLRRPGSSVQKHKIRVNQWGSQRVIQVVSMCLTCGKGGQRIQ